jgi:hypothetical protein
LDPILSQLYPVHTSRPNVSKILYYPPLYAQIWKKCILIYHMQFCSRWRAFLCSLSIGAYLLESGVNVIDIWMGR